MEELLKEIVKEAGMGKIIIDGDDFPIAFNTILYDDNKQVFNNVTDNYFPCLVVKNKEIFLNKITEYVNISLLTRKKIPSFCKDINRNKIKLIISYIFASATTEDFLNPVGLLNKNITFLNDDTFMYLNDGIKTQTLDYFEGSKIEFSNVEQSVFMETPRRIDIAITKEVDGELLKYILPSISYGISYNSKHEKECFIYTLLHPKIKQDKSENQIKYFKKITRELYKLNALVNDSETEEYKEYINKKDDYYPENISDVSPSAIISLAVFISLLEHEKIINIKGVPYLPIRFLSRSLVSQQSDKTFEMDDRNIRLQQNITDKFIRTFRRFQYNFQGLDIISFPYDVSEFIEMKLNYETHSINNLILDNVYNSTLNILNNNQRKK